MKSEKVASKAKKADQKQEKPVRTKKAARQPESAWKNRIVGYEDALASELLANPRNWRTHPQEQKVALAGILGEVGLVQNVIVNKRTGFILDGHARVELAIEKGQSLVPVTFVDLSEAEEGLVLAVLDPIGAMAGQDMAQLEQLLDQVSTEDSGVQALLDALLAGIADGTPDDESEGGLTGDDDVPEVQPEEVSKVGDVWILGRHRVMCGDSTMIDDVEKLMNGKRANLIHADPPYGMGKAADGVANDNLYKEKLDQFQMDWWIPFRSFTENNGSAYIWGNAPDLWRLWYRGGLADSEQLEMRSEIVWDKKCIPGMASPDLTRYPETTERCLFFQFGTQFLGNVNTDDFPERWEPLRAYMESEAKAAGIKPGDIQTVCGCGMYSHWFTKSQFTLIPEKHYKTLQQAYPGRFARKWKELKAEWEKVKGSARAAFLDGTDGGTGRSYFDNAHDIMRDVWEFPRVTGEERHGHATPKPVAMMERVMKSSLPKGGICVEPFGGSGPTLIGAHKTGRICYTMELQAKYVDVIVRRWQAFTGEDAVLESTGKTFNEMERELVGQDA